MIRKSGLRAAYRITEVFRTPSELLADRAFLRWSTAAPAVVRAIAIALTAGAP
jgi:hypothetical protein